MFVNETSTGSPTLSPATPMIDIHMSAESALLPSPESSPRVALSRFDGAPVFTWPGSPAPIRPPPGLELPPWRESTKIAPPMPERKAPAPWRDSSIESMPPLISDWSTETCVSSSMLSHSAFPHGSLINHHYRNGKKVTLGSTRPRSNSISSVHKNSALCSDYSYHHPTYTSPTALYSPQMVEKKRAQHRFVSPYSCSTRATSPGTASPILDSRSSPVMTPNSQPHLTTKQLFRGFERRVAKISPYGEFYVQMVYASNGAQVVVNANETSRDAGQPMVAVRERIDDNNSPDILVPRNKLHRLNGGKRFKVTAFYESEEQLRNREPPRGHWKMVPKYFEMVRRGQKCIEGRPIMGAAANKNVGQLVTLVEKGDNSKRLKIKMTAKHTFANFEEMFTKLGVSRFLPDFRDDAVAEAVDYYRKMPFFAMQEAEKGVVAVEFSLETDQCDIAANRTPSKIFVEEIHAMSAFLPQRAAPVFHLPPQVQPQAKRPILGTPLQPRPANWISIASHLEF